MFEKVATSLKRTPMFSQAYNKAKEKRKPLVRRIPFSKGSMKRRKVTFPLLYSFIYTIFQALIQVISLRSHQAISQLNHLFVKKSMQIKSDHQAQVEVYWMTIQKDLTSQVVRSLSLMNLNALHRPKR